MRSGDDDGNNKNHSANNPFIQFRRYIDSTIISVLNTMTGPSRDFPSEGYSPTKSYPSGPFADLDILKAFAKPGYLPSDLEHLPQPIPNDVPSELDADVFTFQDAFEDLMAVSQGRPLPHIYHVYEKRMMLNSIYGSGGEPFYSWLARLRASRLLPPTVPRGGDIIVHPESYRDRLHEELERRAPQTWDRARQVQREREDDVASEIWKSFHRGLEDTVRFAEGLEKGLRELPSYLRELESERSSKSDQDQPQEKHEDDKVEVKEYDPRQKSQPDHFDDLFLSLRDLANSGQRSWDTLMKTIRESAESTSSRQNPKNRDEQHQTQVEEDREEYIENGYVHSKTTRREVDGEGRELSRSSTYHMYPASAQEGHHEARLIKGEEESGNGLENEKRKQGWFWK